ncbi:MAG: MFS transporter [Spirochaetaceae bacterium]|jgi:fucose permease|nr:MFS transporter [Spirochaetaceae bacterium]
MATVFLLLIYLTFISLGLPDPLFGSAWPVMRGEFGMPLDAAGIVSITISAGTIISSLLSNRIVGRFGPGKVTAVSVFMTAAALLLSSISHSIWMLILASIPLGLGGGSVDAALNNYVALHYKARHMSWLHCSWGIGALIGPLVIGAFIQGNPALGIESGNWRGAYITIGLVQMLIAIILLLSLPLWKRFNQKPLVDTVASASNSDSSNNNDSNNKRAERLSPSPAVNVFKIPGVLTALLTFAMYCAVEYTTGLWGASYLNEMRGFSKADAATAVAFYYAGITIGRALSGFLTMRFSGETLIRSGLCLILVGVAALIIPIPGALIRPALLIIGLGCAPVYPAMIQLTPKRFGAENSQKIIGFQMAFAYSGSTFLPPIVGVIARNTSMLAVPIIMAVFTVVMIFASENTNRKTIQ